MRSPSSSSQKPSGDLRSGAGLSWKGRRTSELGGGGLTSELGAGMVGEEGLERSAGQESAGERLTSRSREARVGGGGVTLDGQEKEKPLIEWE